MWEVEERLPVLSGQRFEVLEVGRVVHCVMIAAVAALMVAVGRHAAMQGIVVFDAFVVAVDVPEVMQTTFEDFVQVQSPVDCLIGFAAVAAFPHLFAPLQVPLKPVGQTEGGLPIIWKYQTVV